MQNNPVNTIFTIGITQEEENQLRPALTQEWKVQAIQGIDSLDQVLKNRRGQASILFVPWDIWKMLPIQGKRTVVSSGKIQPVIFLRTNDRLTPTQIDSLFSDGVFSVASLPLKKNRLQKILRKIAEESAVFQDIVSMAKEINLERELLARKNAQLAFLSQLMARASSSLDPGIILKRVQKDLNVLLTVQDLGAVFWSHPSPDMTEADLYLPNHLSRDDQEHWIEHLLTNASRHANQTITSFHINFIPTAAPVKEAERRLKPGRTVVLPMALGKEKFGALILSSKEADVLGKDRLKILQASVQHLTLAFKNALLYHSARHQADHDGLTRIHNRHHFDKTMVQELKRHQRYSQSLSMLMIDLDHFKQINDTYGHQTGDMVLQEVGKLLSATLRSSDYPARYGGEEFVVILPQTSDDQAWLLAERLRKKLAAVKFRSEGQLFQVTASIGVASLTPGSLQPAAELIREADNALYTAKASGRNMVCSSNGEDGPLCSKEQ